MQRRGQKPRPLTIGLVEQLALGADEQPAAFFFELLVAELVGGGRHQRSVVPRELHGRHGAASRELVDSHRGARI